MRYRLGADSPERYFLDSFDYTALRFELLDALGPAGGRRFRRAVFDYRTDRRVDLPHETAQVDAILLFDGVFLQRPELADVWDIRVWVEAPFDITVARAVERAAAADDRAAEIPAAYERRYIPGQLIYMERCRPRDAADIVIDNTNLEIPRLECRRFGQAV
jgi:uridine kinase